jgi:regulator of replication initiation timing
MSYFDMPPYDYWRFNRIKSQMPPQFDDHYSFLKEQLNIFRTENQRLRLEKDILKEKLDKIAKLVGIDEQTN